LKRRRGVRKIKSLKEKIKGDKASKNMECGKLSKWKKTPTNTSDHLMEKEKGQAGEVLKMRVKWT
jgi:hypothetical protein